MIVKVIATEMAIRLLIQCNEINSVGISDFKSFIE